MKYKTEVDKFKDACLSCPPDYETLNEMLNSGFDINQELDSDEKSILAEVILDSDHLYIDMNRDECRGIEMYELTKFFVSKGFNVSKYGAECLSNLCWFWGEEYILIIAEYLLDNGADTKVDPKIHDGDESVLADVSWKLGDWVVGDGITGNLMTAYYEMLETFEKGGDYHGIRGIKSAYGKAISKIYKVALSEKAAEFNRNRRDAFADGLLFMCEDMPLLLNHYSELYVEPRIKQMSTELLDVTEKYEKLVGLKINDLQFIQGNMGLGLLGFEDTDIRLLFNNGEAGDIKYGLAHIISDNDFVSEIETEVIELLCSSGVRFSETVRRYEEKFVIARCKSSSYLIYSDGKYFEKDHIKILNIRNWLNHGQYRKLVAKHIRFEGLYKSAGSIKGIEFRLGDDRLIFEVDSYHEMKATRLPGTIKADALKTISQIPDKDRLPITYKEMVFD